MSIRIIGIITLFLTFSACGEKKEKRPEHIWDEARMIKVQTEFQKAEAYLRLGYQRFADSTYVADSVFNAVFQKFETNRAEYDSNYSYYLNHPKELEKVYEQVIINLNEASGELEKETKK